MNFNILVGILIPFAGTSLGACCVFFMKKQISQFLQKGLNGFAAGVMIAASVWSLLIPSMEQSAKLGKFQILPTVAGFGIGILFMIFLDKQVSHIYENAQKVSDTKSGFQKKSMLLLAVTLHNIPEGMAVGVGFAGALKNNLALTFTAAFALALGIAIQNIPEGAIISLPLKAEGVSKIKACIFGVASGAVEPLAAFLTILASGLVIPVLPYLLSFAAGAMVYVVIQELIPEMAQGKRSYMGTYMFALGFVIMMSLDVILG